VTGRTVVEGCKRSFEGQADENGNIEWDIEGCRGSAHVAPNSTVKVTCSDPLLVEWPDCWTLMSATWVAHDLNLAGQVIVEPIDPPGQPHQMIPTEGLGVDFTLIPDGDDHVVCVEDAVPTLETAWGEVKTLYR